MTWKKNHWKDLFNYEFLGAYSLEPSRKDITVTIKTINKEQHRTHGGKLDEFTVAYFVEGIKPMILNKTNCSALEKLFGPYPENWEGKQITIYIATGIRNPNGGGHVEALRIRTSAPKVAAKTKSLPMATDIQYQKTLDAVKKGDIKKYTNACRVVNFTDQQHKEINEIIESIM